MFASFASNCFIFLILLFVTSSQQTIISTQQHHERPHVIDAGPTNRLEQPIRHKRVVDDNDVKTSSNLRATRFVARSDVTHDQAIIHWSGDPSQVVFLLDRKRPSPAGVSNSALFRSVDYGKTFDNINAMFDDDTILKYYNAANANKKKLIFTDMFNHSSRIWITEDEGESFQKQQIPFSLDKITFHPDQEDWLLGYDKDAKKLFVSLDLGRTWSKLQDMVTPERYFWGVKDNNEGGNSPEFDSLRVVHMEYLDVTEWSLNTYRVRSCIVPDCSPSPFQPECDAVGPVAANSLQVQNNFVFVEKVNSFQKLYVSHNRGSFRKAQFFPTGGHTNFHVVSSEENVAVVGAVNHRGDAGLYFSDPKGEKFTLSFRRVRYSNMKSGDNKVFTVDVHKAQGMRGVFIANKMLERNHHNQTFITWNYGKTWSNLASPSDESFCGQPRCFVNLHCAMSTTPNGYYMPTMTSKATVPGLIIAHGSVGRTLDNAPSNVNVYVSRDAGKTWTKALRTRHLFRVGDHGAMIVAVKVEYLKRVKTIQFSNSFGQHWRELTFSEEAVHIDGLLNDGSSHFFTLFTHVEYNGDWNFFRLDLSSVVEDRCSYPGDFTNWTVPPYPPGRSQCHIGMITTVETLRRKPCFIGPDYKLKTSNQSCNCTDEDYNCDFGYIMAGNGSCIQDYRGMKKERRRIEEETRRIKEETSEFNDPDSSCVGGWKKTKTRKRRIIGSKCVNDLPEMLHTLDACSEKKILKPTLWLESLNGTREAAVGESLFVSVHGSSDFHWVAMLRSQPSRNASLQRQQNDVVSLTPKHPGYYRVEVFYEGDPHINDSIVLAFWYPIVKVDLVYPPVVQVSTIFNITALVFFGNTVSSSDTDAGNLSYEWELLPEVIEKSGEFVAMRHSMEGEHHFAVIVNNTINRKRSHRSVIVKPYVMTLIVPLVTSTNRIALSFDWLHNVSQHLKEKILEIKRTEELLGGHNIIIARENVEIFTRPRLPLEAQLLLFPGADNQPSQLDLAQAASALGRLIASSSVTIHFQGHVVKLGVPYVTDAKRIQRFEPSQKGVAAVAVSLSALLILIGFYNR